MRTALLLTVGILAGSIPAHAASYVVSPDGSGDYPSISAAVTACVDNDIIELTNGFFTGDENTNVVISGKSIGIISQSGASDECRIDCGTSSAMTKRAFVIENTPASTAVVIAGVGFDNGEAPQDWGGAILVTSAGALELADCGFQNNYASFGGAIAIDDGATVVGGDNCRFIENFCDTKGGAVYCNAGESIWLNCLFLGNESGADGGACHCDTNGQINLSYCTFSRNLAGFSGGAVHYNGQSPMFIAGCTLSGNSCAPGATVYLGPNCTASLINTLIVFTTEGASVACATQNITIENCNFFGNSGGDWPAPIMGYVGTDFNIQEDPQYCSEIPEEHEHWVLQSDSPCTALNNPSGIQIGAWGAGCGSSDPAARSWGALKHEFRR
ncbi:MAG: hypothetical protein GF330_12120 [Candidatus Eisenbacteria bacterium]|nr:hypothetical protein [Candidatus Eisenbacteria bacterium]